MIPPLVLGLLLGSAAYYYVKKTGSQPAPAPAPKPAPAPAPAVVTPVSLDSPEPSPLAPLAPRQEPVQAPLAPRQEPDPAPLTMLREFEPQDAPVAGSESLQEFARQKEVDYSLPENLLVSVINRESRFNKNVGTGGAGEIGVAQIIPKFHPDANPSDPQDSIDYAGKILRKFFDEFGSWKAAIAAYNWGETRVRKQGVEKAPAMTKDYIAFVEKYTRESLS